MTSFGWLIPLVNHLYLQQACFSVLSPSHELSTAFFPDWQVPGPAIAVLVLIQRCHLFSTVT